MKSPALVRVRVKLGARLRTRRTAIGMTQRELSEVSGVRLDTLRSIEQGRTPNPGVFTVSALALAIGISIDSLIHDDTGPG